MIRKEYDDTITALHAQYDVQIDANRGQSVQAAAASGDARVTHAVTGFKRVEVGPVREVRGAPNVSPLIDGEDSSPSVDGHIVVAVALERRILASR